MNNNGENALTVHYLTKKDHFDSVIDDVGKTIRSNCPFKYAVYFSSGTKGQIKRTCRKVEAELSKSASNNPIHQL